MTAVLLTRPQGEADPLAQRLAALGYDARAVPTVALEPLPFAQPEWSAYEWVVVTSANAARWAGIPARVPVAAIGPATVKALPQDAAGRLHMAPTASAEGLGDSLPLSSGSRVLVLRGSASSQVLSQRLQLRGAEVDEVTVYRTVEGPELSRSPLQEVLQDPSLAAVVFASGSAVRGFLRLGGTPSLPAVTIGPETSQVARQQGLRVVAEASRRSEASLADAVASAFPITSSAHD